MFEKQIRIPEPEEIKQLVPRPESLKKVRQEREKLITDVWGYDYYGDDRTLDTHIKMLRQNLGPYRHHIVTLRSMGYKFEE